MKKKLSLRKESIQKLGSRALSQVVGGVDQTDTCLGTQCLCYPTYGPDCHTVGFTQCLCSAGHTNCGCVGG